MFENKVFLVTYGISPESGGVTVATLNQSKMFADANYDVSITTFDYQPHYKQIFNELKSMNRVYPDVHHFNKYEYYAKKNNKEGLIDTRIYEEEFSTDQDGYINIISSNDNQTIHYFKDGELKKTKYYDYDNSRLMAIDYFNSSRELVQRVEFSEEKFVLRKQYFSVRTQNISRESYYNSMGFCFMTRYHNEEGDPGEVFLFERETGNILQFSGNKAHDKHWLNELAEIYKIGKRLPLFISNGQGSGPKIMGIDKKKAKRAYFVHNNHFESPYSYGSKVKKKYDFVFNRIDKLDALIVLTEKQKQDIQKQYGQHNNIYVIPNAITITEHEPRKKADDTIIMVTRLEPQKHLERAISMFHLVVDKIPSAKLNIFGKGSQLKKLQESIIKHEMQDHIFLKGYSRNIKEEIKSSTLSLLTSNYEGLPLAAVESLENETPVVSYDFNYGASDIINDGNSGFVIDLEDEENLADKIVYLLKNKEVAAQMGAFGRQEMISKYSNEVVHQKWMDMLNAIS
ncbi:glycosyltransferase [Peribacillus sp. NPDC006672]|uniref:glycosyltransferase n=1 Tax=Peribacillus sp. NPDC006672 TaxID=3390606 RepID=UPI003D00848F